MIPKLYILCGVSGSGKSYWARKFNKENHITYISRDAIRFSMVAEDEPYFSHEDEVFKKFIYNIAQALIYGNDVIADATHLNTNSRKILISNIDKYIKNYEIIFVSFNIPVMKCLEQNNLRTGRAHVSDKVICSMYVRWEMPNIKEDSRVKEVIKIE